MKGKSSGALGRGASRGRGSSCPVPSPETWAGFLQSLQLGRFSYKVEGAVPLPQLDKHTGCHDLPASFEGSSEPYQISLLSPLSWTPPPPPLPLTPASLVNCRHPSVAFTHLLTALCKSSGGRGGGEDTHEGHFPSRPGHTSSF